MAKDIPDYMRGFDLDEDFGITAVSSAPKTEVKPSVDKKDIESLGQQTSLEISKVKFDILNLCSFTFTDSFMLEIFKA